MAEGFYIYGNAGAGPIDYDTVLGTNSTTTLTHTTAALAYPATWRFGVRAFNANGEEQNTDVVRTVILDASGADASAKPNPTSGLSATAVSGGKIRLAWGYDATNEQAACTQFIIYGDNGTGTIDYATALDTVTKVSGTETSYQWDSAVLTDGVTHKYVVRAATATIEEQNILVASATADSTLPTQPASLSIEVSL